MPQPTDAAIRDRAYELWDRNGRLDGRDIDYWLQAARELEEEERLAATSEDRPMSAGADGLAAGDPDMAPPVTGERTTPDDFRADGRKGVAASVARSGKERRAESGRLRA